MAFYYITEQEKSQQFFVNLFLERFNTPLMIHIPSAAVLVRVVELFKQIRIAVLCGIIRRASIDRVRENDPL